jgi:hypothetical protein
MYGDTEEYNLFDRQYIDGYYMYKGYRVWTRDRCQHGIWGGGVAPRCSYAILITASFIMVFWLLKIVEKIILQ